MSISWIALVMAQAAQPSGQQQPADVILPIGYTIREPETVIVRGRIEPSSQIPASIVTVDATRIQTADDIATAVPGVWMVNDQDPGTNILSMRGATTDRLQQASVAMVLDGVPLADTELFTPRLFDLDKVEVLKGPQGALYGKNAAGGVIAITTRDARAGDSPADDGFAQARIGDGGLGEVEFGQAVALSPTWFLRASGIYSSADGWIENTTLNKKVDSTQTKALRLNVMALQVLNFDLDFRAHYLEEEGGAAWASSNNVTGKTGGRLSGNVLINPIGDYEGKAARRWLQTSARGTRSFGFGSLNVLIARDSYQKRWTEELDYRPGPLTFFGFPAFPNGIQPIAQPIDVRATTAQARWDSSLNGLIDFSIGAFFQDTDKDRIDDFGPLLFGGPASAYATNSRQTAVFGGIEWTPTEDLRIEAQGRFDRDERSQTISNSRTGGRIEKREGTFERFQPRVAASYQFGRLTAFASYGEAFRPGGFNPVPAATSIWKAAYRPEITNSFEIGGKLRDLPNSGRLDFAVFSNTVTDFQNYTFIDNQSVTLNVDEVKVTGFEVSGQFNPFWDSMIGFSYALTNAEIQRFIATDPLLGSPATRNYTGKTVPNAPRETGKIWAQLDSDFFDYDIGLRFDLNYAGTTYYEIDNVLRSPPRVWADLSMFSKREDWTLTVKAENITDERWAISAFGQGMTGLLAGLGPGGPFDTFTINRGRRLSLTLRKDF